VQAVVVGGGDRVELVVVAAGTRDGERHRPLRHGVDPLVDRVVGVHEPLADGDEPERRQARRVVLHIGQKVRRDLLLEEQVVGLVGVERGDDVVAVGPREGVVVLVLRLLGAGRVGIARGVKPVPAPPLAVMRRCEETIDDLGERVG
jgi:hypothetical protein